MAVQNFTEYFLDIIYSMNVKITENQETLNIYFILELDASTVHTKNGRVQPYLDKTEIIVVLLYHELTGLGDFR